MNQEIPGAVSHAWSRWLRDLWPEPVRVNGRERLRAASGALAGILLAGGSGLLIAQIAGTTLWLIAPVGASAVLVFAVPASPMAQPWPVLCGNVLSSLVGIACANLPLPLPLAAALATALAIGAMFATRSMHPPGGAAALLAVLAGQTSWSYVLFPVAINCLLLVLCGSAFNTLTGRRYPHRHQIVEPAGGRFSKADLDAALKHYNQVLDVSSHDLAELLHHAESVAYARQLGDLRCGDIMTAEVVTADYGMPLGEAWQLMRERRIKALPVIDRARRLLGIVTAGDFLKLARLDQAEGIGDRLRAMLRPTGATHSGRPEVVGQVMTRRVQVISRERPLIELLPLLAEAGHHHIPVIDAEHRLAGIVTQTDLVRALYRSVAR